MAQVKSALGRGPVERLAHRDGMIVAVATLAITAMAAWYTFAEAGLAMTVNPVWTPGYALLNLTAFPHDLQSW